MKNLKKFSGSKIEKAKLYNAKGGLMQCTCGTTSVCHIDGTTDSDSEVAY